MISVIALLTDFTWHNWYIGVMKGVIASVNPSASIIDLCHNVSSQDVREGSFVLGSSFAFFPRGTIFVGILTSIFEKTKVERVCAVSPGKYTLTPKGATFFGRDIFAPVAPHLSLGVPPGEIVGEVKSVLTVPALRPSINEQGDNGKLMAIVNSRGLIEIAVNRGNAFRYLGLKEKKSLEIFMFRAVQ